jgi:hypothetical protein
MTKETIEELVRRRDLLAEIAELQTEMPSDYEMTRLAAYVTALKTAQELAEHFPNEADVVKLDSFVENLRAANDLNDQFPSEEDMERVAQHVANLQALAKLPEPPDEDKMEALKAGVAVIKEIDALRAKHPDAQ